jgi:DNA (cytosine-5)-methyltransferase 1
MAGLDIAVPRDGWGNEGVAVGENGLVEWSVLDAQWFGVAQRRRRVFAVLDTGDWASRSPVLLERDSLRGDSPPRREAGEGTAGRAAQCAARGGGHGPDVGFSVTGSITQRYGAKLGTDESCQGSVIPVAGCLAASGGHAYPGTSAQDAGEGFLVPCLAHGQGGAELGLDRSPSLTCNHEAPIAFIQTTAPALLADGFDASEDGTGRGTPLVPVAFDTTQITSAANYSNPQPGDPCHPLAAGAHPPAVAFAQNQRDEVREMEVAGALAAEPGMKQQTYLHTGMAVRRLTPRECERLQGAPDDWTLVPNKHGKPMADGPRYKMLGNSFAVPVVLWSGRQIDRATEESKQEAAA